ncbi:hypothetical protein N806_13850 [Rhodococcus sp. P27]|nr:hypothetical protein N806_13850 [Rhodococcus sp. P27]
MLADSAKAAFVDGMHVAAGATALVLFVSAALVLRMLRSTPENAKR